MAAARALVSVRKIADGGAEGKPVPMPAVLLAPIRPDIVRFVHTSMNKNSRQPYAVSEPAGHQHSAESWGTGRAVSRIPRVSGGGNSRSGQAAFGNMCRKGRMFGPTKIWRKWHKRINQKQKRYATASALAASALPALVQARGHRIDAVEEVPLVADNSLENVTRTKQAIQALKSLGAFADVAKARDSKKLRAGVGKQRNRRHVQRKGPLIVYNQDNGLVRAFRNLPGVDTVQVERLNLLQLAPGGHLGRFVVWTRDAFTKLNQVWGSIRRESTQKKGWTIPRSRVTNSDISRIINSDEVQSKVRPAKKVIRRALLKKNPLTNLGARVRLNPYALALRRSELLAQERRAARKQAVLADRRAGKLSDRSLAEAQGLAANKTHEAQQRINYLKITRDDFDGSPAKLAIRLAKDSIKRGGAPPQATILAATAESKKREKVEEPSVQRGSAMNFAGAAESKLTHSHDRGGIEITIGCRKLVKMDWLSKSDPLVALFIANDAGEYEHYDQTEWKKNNHDPDFDKTIFVPSSLTGKKLRFNVYDVDDDSKVTGDDYMGSVDVIYSSIKEASASGKPVTHSIKHPTDKLQDKKLTKSGANLVLSCKSVGTGFDLKKCLDFSVKHLAGLKRKDIPDPKGFTAELEKRWRHVDRDQSGLVSLEELRQAVWEGEVDNKGKKMPAGKFPPALQDIVDEIHKGTGEKPEFTYWDFLNYTLRDSLAIDDLTVSAPANSPWAYV